MHFENEMFGTCRCRRFKLPARGRLQHSAILRPIGVAAAHRRVSERGNDRPRFPFCTLATVAELVLNVGGPLQVRAEPRVWASSRTVRCSTVVISTVRGRPPLVHEALSLMRSPRSA
jgi:hypothetical protein